MTISRRSFVVSSAAASVAWSTCASKLEDGRDDAVDGKSPLVEDAVNWDAFLARHDLVWDTVPTTWGESPFLGNGNLAMSVRAQPGDNRALWFSTDNIDAYDRRDLTWGWTAYSHSRYHVGDFVLTPVGVITGLRMRLVLHDAELVGSITTSVGSIDFVAFVHADRMIAVVELKTSDGEQKCQWDWRTGQAISSRKPIRNSADRGGMKRRLAIQPKYGLITRLLNGFDTREWK